MISIIHSCLLFGTIYFLGKQEHFTSALMKEQQMLNNDLLYKTDVFETIELVQKCITSKSLRKSRFTNPVGVTNPKYSNAQKNAFVNSVRILSSLVLEQNAVNASKNNSICAA